MFGDSETRMWDFVRAELARGRQAYVVCPLIDESDILEAACGAQSTFKNLSEGELSGFRV